MHMIDLSGQKFARWTVVRRAENTAKGQAMWLCRCECGTERALKSIVIRRGISQSCGCLKLEALVERSTKHGHANLGKISPTYNSWAGMLARCQNPNHKFYTRYGGRGISVCERWCSFENFLTDMGEKPAGHSIERSDLDGDYTPENCRWATAQEQARNKSTTAFMTLGEDTRSLAEWCEALSIHPATMSSRRQAGWTDERALTTPVRRA